MIRRQIGAFYCSSLGVIAPLRVSALQRLTKAPPPPTSVLSFVAPPRL